MYSYEEEKYALNVLKSWNGHTSWPQSMQIPEVSIGNHGFSIKSTWRYEEGSSADDRIFYFVKY